MENISREDALQISHEQLRRYRDRDEVLRRVLLRWEQINFCLSAFKAAMIRLDAPEAWRRGREIWRRLKLLSDFLDEEARKARNQLHKAVRRKDNIFALVDRHTTVFDVRSKQGNSMKYTNANSRTSPYSAGSAEVLLRNQKEKFLRRLRNQKEKFLRRRVGAEMSVDIGISKQFPGNAGGIDVRFKNKNRAIEFVFNALSKAFESHLAGDRDLTAHWFFSAEAVAKTLPDVTIRCSKSLVDVVRESRNKLF